MKYDKTLGYKVYKDRTVESNEYLAVYSPDHPNSWSNGYIYVHRIIAEYKIGRILRDNEVAHHINGDCRDNRPSNIEVMSTEDHTSYHKSKIGKLFVFLECPECGEFFSKRHGNTFLVKGQGRYTACSRSCAGKLNRKEQLGRIKNPKNDIAMKYIVFK